MIAPRIAWVPELPSLPKGPRTFAILCLVATLGACSFFRTPILVHVHPAVGEEMQQWHTYAWMEVPPSRVMGVYSDYMQNHVRAVAEEILFDCGFILSEDEPDFFLAYHASMGGLLAREIMDEFDYLWADWYDPSPPDGEQRWPRGTFILDVVRASDNTLVWRGVAKGGAIGPNPSRRILSQQISHIVPRLLDRFPPDDLGL